jgi:hypothetical protein
MMQNTENKQLKEKLKFFFKKTVFFACAQQASCYFDHIFSKDCSGGNRSPSHHSVRRASTFQGDEFWRVSRDLF